MTTTGREPQASTSAQPVKPSPPSLNRIPVCCENCESCNDEEGWVDEEEEVVERVPKRPCRKTLKKRIKPCVRRSQLNLPGQIPEQFGGKPPCRKLLKVYPRKKRCRPKGEGRGRGGEDEEECQVCNDEETCEKDGGEGEAEGETEDGGDDLFGKKPCRKKKRKPKPPKSPCRPPTAIGGPVPKDERIFPSLPNPHLGEKPPEQKFPPADDASSDKRRRAPCGTSKNKRKPCKKHGSDSSSCSSSSSDDVN